MTACRFNDEKSCALEQCTNLCPINHNYRNNNRGEKNMNEKIKGINAFDFSELETEKEIATGLKIKIVGIQYYAQDKDGNKIAFSRSIKGVDLDKW